MTVDDELLAASTLPADDAFAVLGNETRLKILLTLGEADGPLSFSELQDRVELSDSGQFNYHLRKLTEHFVDRSEDGYALRQAGERIVEAVLSGAVTDSPVVERTRIDLSCPYCDAPVEVRYHQERVEMFCTACDGTWEGGGSSTRGYLGFQSLPPAGLRERTVDEMFRAAWTWQNLQIHAVSSGICPRCSATLDRWVEVCDAHDADDALCDQCHRRYAVQFVFECTNCVFDGQGNMAVCLAATTELLTLLTTHGVNPVAPVDISRLEAIHNDYEETVLATDPFEARFNFAADGDTLALTVGPDLTVVDATTTVSDDA